MRRRLLDWYDAHRRDLPWRRTSDPHRILVSEIMLQQTRVTAVVPYYRRFLKLFPTARAMARARSTSLLRAWAGLGYYSRVRNLHAAAKEIAKRGFPSRYEDVLALPGIGPYTAAAVMSIAFGKPYAVVDGNVRRVLSRLLANGAAGQKEADRLLDASRPGDFNQAIMELGATICLPRNPNCPECPLLRHCRVRGEGNVPAKAKRAPEELHIQSALVMKGKSVLLAPPTGKGLWPDFWTLPTLSLRDAKPVMQFTHTVTFRKIRFEVVTGKPVRVPQGLVFVAPARLARLPLATPARKALTYRSTDPRSRP